MGQYLDSWYHIKHISSVTTTARAGACAAQASRCPSGLRERQHAVANNAGRGELLPPFGGLARRRARPRATKNSSWMPTSSPCSSASPRASISPRTARPWMPSAKWAPARIILGCAHTQANFENAFWRSQHRRQQFLRAMARRRRQGRRACAPTRNGRRCCRIQAPALDQGIDEALKAFMAKRKETLPDKCRIIGHRNHHRVGVGTAAKGTPEPERGHSRCKSGSRRCQFPMRCRTRGVAPGLSAV